jgi:hypothetical protein
MIYTKHPISSLSERLKGFSVRIPEKYPNSVEKGILKEERGDTLNEIQNSGD